MKDKHINLPSDSGLLKKIYTEAEQQLSIRKGATARFLLGKAIVYIFLVVFFYVLIWHTSQLPVLFIAYSAFGLSAVLLGFNFAHDFSHNTVFNNKRLNHFFYALIYTLLGAHAEAWKYRHVHSHHYAPNVKDYDSDLQITALIRVEPTAPLRWYHRYQHLYALPAYTTYSLYWVLIKDFVLFYTDKSFPEKKSAAYRLSFWIQKIFYLSYLLVLPMLLTGFAWHSVLLAFLLMHALQSLFLLVTFFMTHHVESTHYFSADENGFIQASWFTNQVKSSNDFYPFSKTANFIFGGFNNHIAHHLFPHIHHIHYPSLNRILYRVLRAHGIEPNVTGFFSGALSHLRHLKKMGRKKDATENDASLSSL